MSLLGIHPDKTTIQKDTCTPMFTVALFTITKINIPPKCTSTDKWIKMWYIYVQWNISHKKEQNNAICSNMEATREYHTK